MVARFKTRVLNDITVIMPSAVAGRRHDWIIRIWIGWIRHAISDFEQVDVVKPVFVAGRVVGGEPEAQTAVGCGLAVGGEVNGELLPLRGQVDDLVGEAVVGVGIAVLVYVDAHIMPAVRFGGKVEAVRRVGL